MQKHSQHNNDERRHVFRKKNLSLYSKVLRKGYVWEVTWRLKKDCNILTPSSSGYSSTSFSSSGAAQPGALRAHLSAGSGPHCFELQQLTPNSDHHRTRTSCSTGLDNCLTSTCFSECPRGVMVKAMNCGIVVREFVLQSRYYVHFRANTLGKGMNPLILPPAMGK